MANNVTNEQIRVSLDVLTPSQSIVDLAVRFPIYVLNEYHTVQSDCEQTDTSAGDYIKNKPNLDLKADKVTNATGGNFASLDSNGNIVDSERSVEKVDNNDTSNLPTLDKVNALFEAMPEPMLFKGSLGTGGTITTLPDASSLNEGFTYKVITAGTYAGQIAKIGDTFISDGTQWVLIPSGDEPSGTVTSIKIKANTPINIDTDEAITTSGERTISHANSGATAGNYGDSAAQTPAYGATFKVPYVAVNATGHVTEISEHTVKIPASDNTDTHRPIQMNDTEILGNDTTALNLKAGSNVTLTNSSGTVTIASSDSTKADKVSSATNGNFAGLDANGNLTDSGIAASNVIQKVSGATNGNFAGLDANGNLTDSGKKASDFKTVQTAVSDPTASGTSTTAITNITQDANGVIVPTKKTIVDTKNTAGSTDSSSKLFLVGATSQASNPQTYSDDEVYTTNGVLTTKSVQVGGGAATIQWNSNNNAIDFNFI